MNSIIFSYIRKGLSAHLSEFQSSNGSHAQVDFKIEVALERRGGGLENRELACPVTLIGPAEIKNISENSINLVNPPKNSSIKIKKEFCPYIEFFEEDLPWRYTPIPSDKQSFCPWMALIALKEGEYDVQFVNNRRTLNISVPQERYSLIFPTVKNKVDGFFKLANLAHAQFLTDKSILSKEEISTILKESPDSGVSRIFCGSTLEKGVRYEVFLIPSFELGRRSGLGISVDGVDMEDPAWIEPNEVDALARQASKPNGMQFPIYYQWGFQTDELGSFKELAEKLRYVTHPDGGQTEFSSCLNVEVSDVKINNGNVSEKSPENLKVLAALKPLQSEIKSDSDCYINDLKTRLEKSPVFLENATGTIDETEDPYVVPPVYGARHLLSTGLNTNIKNVVDSVNLKLENRIVAGMGREVVRRNQEEFVNRAWRKVEKINQLNQEIREYYSMNMVENSARKKCSEMDMKLRSRINLLHSEKSEAHKCTFKKKYEGIKNDVVSRTLQSARIYKEKFNADHLRQKLVVEKTESTSSSKVVEAQFRGMVEQDFDFHTIFTNVEKNFQTELLELGKFDKLPESVTLEIKNYLNERLTQFVDAHYGSNRLNVQSQLQKGIDLIYDRLDNLTVNRFLGSQSVLSNEFSSLLTNTGASIIESQIKVSESAKTNISPKTRSAFTNIQTVGLTNSADCRPQRYVPETQNGDWDIKQGITNEELGLLFTLKTWNDVLKDEDVNKFLVSAYRFGHGYDSFFDAYKNKLNEYRWVYMFRNYFDIGVDDSSQKIYFLSNGKLEGKESKMTYLISPTAESVINAILRKNDNSTYPLELDKLIQSASSVVKNHWDVFDFKKTEDDVFDFPVEYFSSKLFVSVSLNGKEHLGIIVSDEAYDPILKSISDKFGNKKPKDFFVIPYGNEGMGMYVFKHSYAMKSEKMIFDRKVGEAEFKQEDGRFHPIPKDGKFRISMASGMKETTIENFLTQSAGYASLDALLEYLLFHEKREYKYELKTKARGNYVSIELTVNADENNSKTYYYSLKAKSEIGVRVVDGNVEFDDFEFYRHLAFLKHNIDEIETYIWEPCRAKYIDDESYSESNSSTFVVRDDDESLGNLFSSFLSADNVLDDVLSDINRDSWFVGLSEIAPDKFKNQGSLTLEENGPKADDTCDITRQNRERINEIVEHYGVTEDNQLLKYKKGNALSKYPVMAYPEFLDPTQYYLAELCTKYILPSVNELPLNSVSCYLTNLAFEESFLMGMNTEMGQELLFREYPTDQRGSYFRKFWDSFKLPSDVSSYYDVAELQDWNKSLGQNHTKGNDPLLVYVIRAELLLAYPKIAIYLASSSLQENGRKSVEVRLEPTIFSWLTADTCIVGFSGVQDPSLYELAFLEEEGSLQYQKVENTLEFVKRYIHLLNTTEKK